MNVKQIIISLFILMLLLASCGENKNKTISIASAGDREIDWKQLNRSFHLNSQWSNGITHLKAYQHQLDYLIRQKIFAQEAIKAGLDKEESINQYLNFILKKEMIKELYRQEVASQIEISEEEYKNAYSYLKKKVKFAYFSSSNKKNAEKYAAAFKEKSFPEITLISNMTDEKGISPMFAYGDMAEELEEIVFNMGKDEISGPVKVGSRHMVVKLIDGRIDKFMSDMDFHEKKSKIKKVMFERRASKISGKFIEKIMADKKVKINPAVFFPLTEYFSKTIQNKNSTEPYPIYIDDKELKKSINDVSDLLNKNIVSYEGGAVTVKDFFNELKSMPAGLRPRVNMAQPLKKALAQMVRDKHLAAEAKENGLDKNTTVLYETQIQTDEILAKYYLKKVRDGITCTLQEIEEFKNKENFAIVNQQYHNKLTDGVIEDIIGDYKFSLQKIQLADSLKINYACKVDSSEFMVHISEPDKVIKEKPINMSFLEKYR